MRSNSITGFGATAQQQRTFNINADTDTYFYTQRGSDRMPNWYALNFALQADFRVFGPVEFGIKGEVRNLTNQQEVVALGGNSLLPNAGYGQPRSRNDLVIPRNYQFSAVVKF